MKEPATTLPQCVLGQVAGEDALCCVGRDIDEPADSCEGDDDEDDVFPPVEAVDSLVDVDGSEDVHEGGQEDRCQKFIVFHGVEPSDEVVLGKSAVLVAFGACIAEGHACQIDVAVGVGSDVAEEAGAAAFVTGFSQFIGAAGGGVAGEELHE